MSKLFYSRYHISSGNTFASKIDFIRAGIRNEASISDRGFLYKFLNSETFEFQSNLYFTGELVKYNPDDSEEVVDDSTMTIKNETILNKVVARSRYIIDPSSSILMHIDVPNHISLSTFRKKFSQLFEKNHDNFFAEFSLSPIKEQYSFVEKINSFKFIKRISITLFPSNPNFADDWKEIDERLRAAQIEKYTETQETKKPNSSIIIDKETHNKFLMSEDGYGTCSATGTTITGSETTISTDGDQKNVSISLPPEITYVIEILAFAKMRLEEIIQRTLK